MISRLNIIVLFTIVKISESNIETDGCPDLSPNRVDSNSVEGDWYIVKTSKTLPATNSVCFPYTLTISNDNAGRLLTVSQSGFSSDEELELELTNELDENDSTMLGNVSGNPNNPKVTIIYADDSFVLMALCRELGSVFVSHQAWVMAREPQPNPYLLQIVLLELKLHGLSTQMMDIDRSTCFDSDEDGNHFGFKVLFSNYPGQAKKLSTEVRQKQAHSRYLDCKYSASRTEEAQFCWDRYQRELKEAEEN